MPRTSQLMAGDARLLYTVGHSTHPIETFLALLSRHQIAQLADVRSFPGSRRWPQFNREQLAVSLEAAGVAYEWLRALGGRRHSRPALSAHAAWQSAAFRSYADYTESAEFSEGIQQLLEIATRCRTAIMCAEGLWWRCHRRLIADHVMVRGWAVRHIMPDGKLAGHALPAFATIADGRIIYDDGRRQT